MNCLILGGNGFIGSHLLDKLLSENHHVRIFDKYNELYRPKNIKVDYHYGDFGNRVLVASALSDIDIVFHLITTTVPKTSNDDPIFDVQSNVIETLYLLEQCVAQKTKKIIFVSSGGTIYGMTERLPISEDCPTNPECSYGITKLTIEKYLALFSHLYGLDYTVVRPSNPYGSRQNPSGIQGVISVFLGRVIQDRPIEIWGDGETIRDYVFIDDLVNGIYVAAVKKTSSRIFNLGSGEGRSLNDIVQVISKVASCEVKIDYKEKRLFDVSKIFLNISRAKEQLCWKPNTSLENGIEQTFRFIEKLYRQSNVSDSGKQ
jgi:UDP-glucose 4-epimerase